ncbi:MAG: AAA family ATPase [Lachnospiraceae bacterium]|nr:AAA family ATPase [Lachnospiraceae bacterium]
MKLIQCHIENFGKISQQTFDFTPGLNVFCQENGWGKSTLAAFIKTMFYGFENDKKRDLLENERKRYKPWQGGVYGGNISFEANGKEYLLIRTFGEKESDDVFLLQDKNTRIASGDFTKNIGEELFLLDGASFKRSIMISQNDCVTFPTDSINTKLGNLTGEEGDLNSFEDAMEHLKKNVNSYERSTGLIHKLKEEIAEQEKKLIALPSLEENLKSKTEGAKLLKEERDRCNGKLRECSSYLAQISCNRVNAEKQSRYESLLKSEKERRESFDRARGFFRGELPEAEELKDKIRESGSLKALEEGVRMTTFTDEELRLENRLGEIYRERLSKQEDPEGRRRDVRTYFEKAGSYEKKILSVNEKETLDACRSLFAGKDVDNAGLQEYMDLWEECRSKKMSLAGKKEVLEILKSEQQAQKETKPSKKKFPVAGLVLLICGGVLAVAGILLAMLEPITGIVTALFGLVCITAGMVVILVNNRKELPQPEDTTKVQQLAGLEEEIIHGESFIKNGESRIRAFLAELGWNETGSDVLKELYEIKEKYRTYTTLAEKEAGLQQDHTPDEMRYLAERIESYILGFCPDFNGITTNRPNGSIAENTRFVLENLDKSEEIRALWNQSLDRIESESRQWKTLCEKRKSFEAKQEEYESLKRSLRNYILGLELEIKEPLQDCLLDIENRLEAVQNCRKEYEGAKASREAFEAVENMEEIRSGVFEEIPVTEEACKADMEEANVRLEEIGSLLVQYQSQIQSLGEQQDELTEAAERRALLKERLKEAEKRHKLLKVTRGHLEKAKTSFTARYTKPVSDGFKKYYGMLSGEAGDRFQFDANTNLSITEQGLPRDPKAFSAGCRDMAGICFRMALVDAMYTEEKPMVLFDDPFVNLDEEKTKGGMRLLQEISREYQVIYFTCHGSRTGR